MSAPGFREMLNNIHRMDRVLIDLTIAQFRPAKGDLEKTLEDFGLLMSDVLAQTPTSQLVVFPETALTGYFLEGGVREQALSAQEMFDQLNKKYAEISTESVDIAIGFYEVDAGRIYNSSMYARLGPDGGVVHVHRKTFLPTYGVFQEERFVEAGPRIVAFDGPLGRTALLICEEAFHSISGTLAALDGAEIILVLSASPGRGAPPGSGVPANVARWDLLGSGLAAEHGVFVIVSQLVGFEGGKGFAGGSAAYDPFGHRLIAGPLWEEAILSVTLDLDTVTQARTEEPLFSALERTWTRLLVNSPGAGVGHPDIIRAKTTGASDGGGTA